MLFIFIFIFIVVVIIEIAFGLIGGKIARDMGLPSWIGILLGLLVGVILYFLNK